MEPNKLDELSRRVIQEKESQALLDKENADLLWNKLDVSESKSYGWLWKAASVALLMLSSVLTIYLLGNRQENLELQSELTQTEIDNSELSSELEQQSSLVDSYNKEQKKELKQERSLIEQETIIQYVVKEQIVYRDREVFVSSSIEVDSLLSEIAMREDEISMLSNSIIEEEDLPEYPNNFTVAFGENKQEDKKGRTKTSRLRFQLALLNRK